MNNNDEAERFIESDLRIGTILWLAAEAVDHTWGSDAFKEFCEDHTSGELKEILGAYLPKGTFDDSEYLDADDLLEHIVGSRCFGFLIQFQSPVRTYLSRTSYQSGWGHYRCHWIYRPHLDEAINEGHAWAEEMHKRDAEKVVA